MAFGERIDHADAGAAEIRGYTPAEAAQMFQEFLEGRLSLQGFAEWLDRYPYAPDGPAPARVEDEINRATLAIRALQQGTRDEETVRRELMSARSRLSGHAFQSGQLHPSGSRTDPTGKPVDRSFP